MLFIPLPFVAALLLLILFGQMCLREQAASRHFRILVLLLCLLAIVIGVRWGYGIERVLPAQAILASAVGPLAWICFAAFVAEQGNRPAHRFCPHPLPSLLVAILIVARPQLDRRYPHRHLRLVCGGARTSGLGRNRRARSGACSTARTPPRSSPQQRSLSSCCSEPRLRSHRETHPHLRQKRCSQRLRPTTTRISWRA